MTTRFITVPTQDALSDDFVAQLRAMIPGWNPNSSDPGVYIADFLASRLIDFINQHNDGANEVNPLTASIAGLIEILKSMGLDDPMGDAENLRAQIHDRWNSLASGTRFFVRQLAFKADEDLDAIEVARDIIRSRSYLFGTYEEGVALTDTQREALQTTMNADIDERTKVLWWDYFVLSTLHIAYEIIGEVTYKTGTTEEDIKIAVEAAIIAESTALAKPYREISDTHLESVVYQNDTVVYCDLQLAPTRLVDPVDWQEGDSPYVPAAGYTIQTRSRTSTLTDTNRGVRPTEAGNQPEEFAVNIEDYELQSNQYIRIQRGSWSIEGYIVGPVLPSSDTGEVAQLIDLTGATKSGNYSTGTGGAVLTGPIPRHSADIAIGTQRLPRDRGVVYGPGTIAIDAITYTEEVE